VSGQTAARRLQRVKHRQLCILIAIRKRSKAHKGIDLKAAAAKQQHQANTADRSTRREKLGAW